MLDLFDPSQFDTVANVSYAGAYGRFLDGISAMVGFDLGVVLAAGCIAEFDFHQRLLVATLWPLGAVVLLGVTYRVAVRRNPGSQDAVQTAQRKHMSVALLVSFFVYSSVSSTVFRMFACEPLDDGKEYLRADYTIECDSRKHVLLRGYSIFMVFVYPIGVPTLYAFLLCSKHDVLTDERRRGDAGSLDVQVTADLWKPYTGKRFYYEVVECARRVALTGVVVFVCPNTAAQIAVTLVLAFAFFAVLEVLAPYISTVDSWLSRAGHIEVFMSMFQALLFKVDVSDERDDSQEVFGGVLLAANICMVVVVVAETMLITCSFCLKNTAIEESTKPVFRTTGSATKVMNSWETFMKGVDSETHPNASTG